MTNETKRRKIVYDAPAGSFKPDGMSFPAYETSVPGLVIVKVNPHSLSLTHALTGMGVVKVRNIKQGRYVAGVLGALADWNKSDKEVRQSLYRFPIFMAWLGCLMTGKPGETL